MQTISLSSRIQKTFLKKPALIISITALLFLASSCHKIFDAVINETIYVGSNDYHDNQNAIFAYKANEKGVLEQIPGSPFYTHGSGVSNPTQKLGPDDVETPVIIYKNKYLLAVNGGSNTIAVFEININGTLHPVAGSPFPSGGATPSSLATSGNYLYVVNKSDDPLHPSKLNPNYTTFTIANDGTLKPVDNSTYETVAGSSPSQVYISNDEKFAFGEDFLSFMLTPAKGTLRSFKRNDNGSLGAVAGTPYSIPVKGGALGLWQHPKANVLYVGFPVTAQLGIYNIDASSGALTYQSSVSGGLASCWIRVTSDGKYLYLLNSAENTISVYNSSNPTSLVFINKFALKKPGPLYPSATPGVNFTTSEDFHLAFSKDEKLLYVVSQQTNVDISVGNYNFLHTLYVGNDGNLSEPLEPVQLPVSADIRPQGVAVY
jgi:6-phosphogluconolactonase (cycloisomerase 2 family)